MLSLEVPWQAVLCWAVVPSTSSAPLGHPHPSSGTHCAQEHKGRYPWVPTWAGESGASHLGEELLAGTGQSLRALLLPKTFSASASFLLHTLMRQSQKLAHRAEQPPLPGAPRHS